MDREVKLEFQRDLFHSLGLAIPIGYCFFPKEVVLLGVLGAMVFYVGSDLLRLFHGGFRRFFYRLLGDKLLKDREQKNLIGSSYFLIGAFLILLFFQREAVIPALFVACLSDIAASEVGSRWGKHRFRSSRSLEGSLAFFASASVLIFILYPGPFLWGMAVSLVATLVEALSVGVDDNLSIPLVTAGLLHLGL
ncbi:MAG: hypothetical protein DRG31_01455 [Deltaproteobacteria bacterium]|nr:MAG: hypothetical protein DRG31_01455 [Deltaproteobacteria bacterium]